jgi:hypothetical protein
MAEDLIEEDDDEELIPVDEPIEDSRQDDDGDDEEEEEDTRLADEADEDEDGDTTVSPKRDKRLKRRKIQKLAKENAQRELRLLREQNASMATRLAAVEGNALSQNEMALDGRINEARQEIQQAEQIIARAIEAGNGDDVAVALRIRDDAKAREAQLGAVKQQVTHARQQPANTPDPRVTSLAQEWMAANPWYDPKGGNEDSAITNAIDTRLVAEGFDPTTVAYWQELTGRLRNRIAAPRAKGDGKGGDMKNPKKKAPPMGNAREHAPQSTKKEVYVTPDRKQAMIDAGIWDDPTRRNQMLKAYQAYDRNSAR